MREKYPRREAGGENPEALLRQVLCQAKALGIPVSEKVDPIVRINYRAKARFGICRETRKGFQIEISGFVAEGPEQAILQVIAHEILHTCPGCRNHGARWKCWAEKMNKAWGYRIRSVSTADELGLEQDSFSKHRTALYCLECAACGAIFERYRKSRLVREPGRYRCRCGGALKRKEERK